jgi:PKD repeat protein
MKKLIAVLGLLASFALAAPALAQVYAQPYTASVGYGYAQPGYAQPFCPVLSYNLYIGLGDRQTQGQVTQMQQYLSTRGMYQPVTGYFGSITRANVAQFQQQYAVYPITGGVGPLTRAAIARTCGGTVYPPTNGSVSISNISGPNTLAVGQQGTWSITTNAPFGSYLSTSVRWGDEILYPYLASPQGTAYASQQSSFSHTYAQAGTYTVTFTVTDSAGRSSSANTTVVVGSGSGCTFNCQTGLTITSPVQGQTYSRGGQMPITWSGLIHQTFAYEQDSSIVDLYSTASGKVGTIAIQNGIAGSYTWSIPPFPNNQFCTLQYPNGLCGTNIPDGQYYIKVTVVTGNGFDSNATQIASQNSGTFSITGSGTGCSVNCQGVSAFPQSGPAPLTVTFSLTNYTGQYAVDFGDGTQASLQSGSISHTYFNRGTYTAQFTSDLACMHTTPRCMIATQLLGSATVTAY